MLIFDLERHLLRIRAKTMSTTAKEAPSSLFSLLPNEIVLNILARVPRWYHPILSCVSKNLRSLVSSSELKITRSLLEKDRFYVCFQEHSNSPSLTTYHWFSFTENRRCLVSILFTSLVEPYFATLTLGPEIYFVGKSRRMWILDSRSGKLRQGPRPLVACDQAAVGLVNDKIYVFGGIDDMNKRYYEGIHAQVFDLKTQTWHVGPNLSVKLACLNRSVVTPSLGRKIYVRGTDRDVTIYDIKDGKCDKIIPADDFSSGDMCVVDNVIYMYYHNVGLMWYESKEKQWSVVHGLEFNGFFNSIAIAEYNGKLAFLCAMIDLYGSSKVAIRGRVEWSHRLLSDIPSNYNLKHFTICTDY
ncbi:putative F-box/kelch-repeat protein [Arabidopsis thaliana]